jgi:uncharacterized membrane protein YhaH (DUF805 family)
MQYYINAIKNYATFSGRARRKEYWMFVLFNMIFSFIASLIDTGLNIMVDGGSIRIISLIYSLFILLPYLSLEVRRLHDTDMAGGWILVGLIPMIGWILLIVFYCTAGTIGENRFGEDPKKSNSELDYLGGFIE